MDTRAVLVLSLVLPLSLAARLPAQVTLESAVRSAGEMLASDKGKDRSEGPAFKLSWPIVKKMHKARFAGADDEGLAGLKGQAEARIA